MSERRLYGKFTLDYPDSHKIAPLSDAAFRAHVTMVLWSRRHLTDGKIPAAMALVIAGRRPKVLAELCSNDPEHPSLTRDEAGDYWLHDFLVHQSSRAEVEAKQATNRANGARGGQAKAQRTATNSVSDSPTDDVADVYTETQTETETPLTADAVRGPRKRATRIPDEFFISKEMTEWAHIEVPGVDIARSTRMFVDHFRAASGATATKKDWVAAWRNWLRRDAGTLGPRPAIGRESSLDRRNRQRDAMFAELATLGDSPMKEIGA